MDCKTKRHILALLLLIAGCLLPTACRMSVSLTGSSIDARAKTVYIQTFRNNSTLVNPTLSQQFTNALKDRIQGQTPLTIVDSKSNGDYSLEGL